MSPDSKRQGISTDDDTKTATLLIQPRVLPNDIPIKNIHQQDNITIESAKNDRIPMEAEYVGWQQIGHYEASKEELSSNVLLAVNIETFRGNIIPRKYLGDWYFHVALFALVGILSFLL